MIIKAEREDTWKAFLLVYRRGLSGEQLRLVVTDGQKGAPKAIAYLRPRSAHQRCWVHKLCNLSNRLKRSQQNCIAEGRDIYEAANRTEALKGFRQRKLKWLNTAAKAVHCIQSDLEALLEFSDCPRPLWKKLRATNAIERLFVKCAAGSERCAPLPPAVPVNEYSLASLIE